MDILESRKRLQSFLGGRVLTFAVREESSGEWVAECNEIAGIMTCGMGPDISDRDALIRDAILTAAGVDTRYADQLLQFVGYKPVNMLRQFFTETGQRAEYVVA